MPRNPNIVATLSPLDQLQQRLGTTSIPTLVDRNTALQSAKHLLTLEQQLMEDTMSVGMISVLLGYAANLIGWRRSLMQQGPNGRSRKPWETALHHNDTRIHGGKQEELEKIARQMITDPAYCIDRINSILDRLPKHP